jgi:hypothetical protein
MGFVQLIEELRQIDEVTLLELLDINADDLIDAFYEKINDRYDYINDYLDNKN